MQPALVRGVSIFQLLFLYFSFGLLKCDFVWRVVVVSVSGYSVNIHEPNIFVIQYLTTLAQGPPYVQGQQGPGHLHLGGRGLGGEWGLCRGASHEEHQSRPQP